MAEYLNDFHKKNSEAVMKHLSRQRQFSPEEMLAQIEAHHQKIAEQEQQSKKSTKKED